MCDVWCSVPRLFSVAGSGLQFLKSGSLKEVKGDAIVHNTPNASCCECDSHESSKDAQGPIQVPAKTVSGWFLYGKPHETGVRKCHWCTA